MDIKIAIDAGHGSNTPGKRTPDGYLEHWANVKVARCFAEAMDRMGIPYIRTGWNDENAIDDEDMSLAARQRAIRAAGCGYSVSFHFNAYGDGKSYNPASGVGVFVSNKQDAVGDSMRFAAIAMEELAKGTKQKNRGVKRKALSMCNCKLMKTKASILIECAFMTNQAEAKLMKSDAFCRECAEETAKAYCKYLGITYIPGTEAALPQDAPQAPQEKPTVLYKVKTAEKWLPEVRGDEDYAGNKGQAVYGFACWMSDGSPIKYRVHTLAGSWLPYVTGYDVRDFRNGYAGDGKTKIDAIEIHHDGVTIAYKVAPVSGKSYYATVIDGVTKGKNAYAGVFGKAIDKVVCWVM